MYSNKMKNKILNAFTGIILFLMPNVTFGQAPSLGNAAGFVLFTTNGAMTCSGTKYLTHLTGNVGANLAGSVTGFGNVDGVMHQFDVATGLCAPDVVSLYTELSTEIPTDTLASTFGGGDTLIAGVYDATGAATLTSNLVLNGQGNPNALFIFQIGGVLSTNALSKVTLINGALACNVFWQINGAVNVGTGTTLRGTIVANGQIDMTSTLDTLEGRAFAINAAVLVSQLVAYTPIGCGSALLTGPAAPAILDSTAAYGVFSSIGAVTSTPVTYIIGSVGANSTIPTGFIPLDVTGTIHAMDPSTAAAAADLTNIYNYLVALPADIDLLDPPDFGHGLVLTPHAYQVTGITQLTGNIILNAEGDANAVFVIKINGSFTTSVSSKVILINGAQAKNVYWKIDGAVDIYSNSVFNGTLVVAGAISLETGDTLNGRALTINGAIAINASYVDITATNCVAPAITGTMNVCPGGTTTLSDTSAGGAWSSNNTTIATIGSSSGIVSGLMPGNVGITYTTIAGCTSTANFTVNPSPAAITGPGSVCPGGSITLIDTTFGGTWSSSNTALATVGSVSGIVTGVANGMPTISYTIPAGCVAVKTITVNSSSSAGSITGPSNVCVASTITLADTATGGTWSSSNNARAIVAGGVVTGVSAGTDTVLYTITTSCGTAIATKTITIGSVTSAGSITGPSNVCVASTITLADTATGGTWSSSNNARAIVAGGVVTGVSAGTDTVLYSVTTMCGTAIATKTITIGSVTSAGSITGPSNVCVGATITLADTAAGGIWSSSSNTRAIVSGGVVTGVSAGTDTVIYTVTTTCGTATATKAITVNPLPDAGNITGLSNVCVGSTIILTDSITGGTWSSSDANATIGSAGSLSTIVINGVTAGSAIISYTVSSLCGTYYATKAITINPLPVSASISGPSSVCVGSSITLTDATPGGIWSSSNANATVGSTVSPSTGMVNGITAGTTIISYTFSNLCSTGVATKTITVNPLPDPGTITGATSVCVGSSTSLIDGVTGTWSSSNANANVGTTGVVNGMTAGTAIISYSVSNLCGLASATRTITVNPLPDAGTITGLSNVCIGSDIILADAVTPGTWGSSNTSATVSGGVVTGIIPGTDTISYTVTNVCGTTQTTKTIAVNPLPDAGSITGAASVCVNATITLTDGVSGGVWSSSNAMAIVSGGIVTGVTAGTDTISYTVTNVCGSIPATKAILVNPLPDAGIITGAPGVCVGSTTILSDSITGGVWSSSNALASISGNVIMGITPGIDTISYAVTNLCGTATVTKNIAVNALPLLPVITTQAPSTACLGTMYQNYGTATPASAGTTYSWTAVNATVWAQGAGRQYALVNFTETGTASVILNVTATGTGCISQSAMTVIVGTSIAQTPEVVYFSSHFVCTPANEGSYQWGYDDVTTLDSAMFIGEINQDYINTSPDFYNKDYWAMTTLGGCLQKTYYHVPTAIQNVTNNLSGISVYPNPANTFINVETDATIPGSIRTDVFNVMGQKISTVAAVNNIANIDVSAFPAGTYLIACYRDGIKIADSRFIKN